ncbi:uncharacterized protein LOC142340336 [Convolutriloba macropyga]|uniref:uncharacterized protein LOC142340336 n=1 Tax=Convolutriloba macropyga TaxID=536237 RepID=UPI003F51B993
MLMFPDDKKFYGRADSPGDEEKLQEDLNATFEWIKQWQLQFHTERAKLTHVGKMTFDSTLMFEVHMAEKVMKANRIPGIIRKTFHFRDDETLELLFCSLVRPHLEYASSVWSQHLMKLMTMVENMQRRAIRLPKNSKSQPYEDRLRRLNLPTLSFRGLSRDMIEVFKIVHPTAR